MNDYGHVHRQVAHAAITAALTEAKQQWPGEALTELDRSIINEAAEVLEAVGVSGVSLPANWRWPLADELSGIAAAPQVEAKRQTGEGFVLVPVARLREWRSAFCEEAAAYAPDTLHHVDTSIAQLDEVIAAAAKPSGEVGS